MNWLDEYIANNKTGYYVGNDGSLWVDAVYLTKIMKVDDIR